MVNIVLKREAKVFLEKNKNKIECLVIDGSLDKEYVKTCGCCGPPPSPDYTVEIIEKGKNNLDLELIVKDKRRESKIVDIWIDKQLYEAITTARMNIVLFYLETANEENSGYLVAKVI
ncbi:MAG: hypothetical protein ACTSWN_17050 [Promethearchaeota archaeon]